MKLLIGVVLMLSLLLVSCGGPDPSVAGEYDELAKCLTAEGVKMYGTEWCSHCKNQKEAFGSSFQYVDYVDCDDNSAACTAAGVEGYPTWVIDGQKYPGEQALDKLAGLTGC